MQILKAIVDTQRTNTTIGYVNTGDVVKLNLQVISNGEIGDNWVNPVIELHGIKSDKTCVRQTDNIQIVDLANHYLEITLHEQFMTCDGLVRLQLLIKDEGGRISSSVFYLRVTKSLEMDVMESHDYIQVFDDFDTYMELVKEFEAKMKEDVTLLEAEIQKVSDLSQSVSKNEAERQEAFEMNESNREVQFNQTQQTLEDRFNQDQNTRETQFNASQSSQTSTFTTNEAERQKGETQRVTNENARQTAECNREVRMAELETKTSELIEKADEQVLKVDEFINANTKHLLEEDARKDYMGNECRSIRETMNSNVDYAVKTAIGEFNYLDYEGQQITANNSIEGHVKSAILCGKTLVNISSLTGVTTLKPGDVIFIENSGMKTNTTYTIMFNCSNTPSTNFVEIRTMMDNTQITQVKQNVSAGYNKFTIKTNTSKETNRFRFKNDTSATTDFIFSELLILEGNYTNENISYFEGMASVKMPVLTTTGKNLFNLTSLNPQSGVIINEQSPNKLSWEISEWSYWHLYSQPVYVGKGTIITIGSTSMTNCNINVNNYSTKETIINIDKSMLKTTIESPSDYIYFDFRSNNTNLKCSVSEFRVNVGSTLQPYESHKSNILTVNEEVELGSIENVRDELNLLTGELTQKTTESYINNFTARWFVGANKNLPFYIYKRIGRMSGSDFICDKLPVCLTPTINTNYECLAKGNYEFGDIIMYIPQNNITTLDEAVQRLNSYNAKIRYVLNNPTIKTVDLSDNVVYSYDEVTHYDGSSESGSLVPTLAVKVPTNVNAVISSQRATIQEQTEQINTLEKENTLLTEQNEKQDVDIALNQDAINFMLFEVMGLSNDDDANKLNPMAIYFANQILKGKLTYTQVIGKYPQFKDDIDSCLVAEGRSDLIVKID